MFDESSPGAEDLLLLDILGVLLIFGGMVSLKVSLWGLGSMLLGGLLMWFGHRSYNAMTRRLSAEVTEVHLRRRR